MTIERQGGGLVRAIRRADLGALIVNNIVGAGIFGLPATAFALAGGYSLLAFVACAIVVTLIVLCFAELGSRFATTGGPYLYARAAFGPWVGFQVGWLMWLSRLTAFGAICNLLVGYLGYFWSGANAWRAVVIVAVVAALTLLNVLGVRRAAVTSTVFTIGKLIPLLSFVAVGAFFVEPANLSFAAVPTYGGFAQAVFLVAFAFMGFEVGGIPAGETNDPRRHLPSALLTGIGVVAVLYVLIQLVCIGTLPELAASQRPLADAASRAVGPAGAAVIVAGALISVTGTLNVVVLTTPRLLYAMAEHGDLPPVFASTHPRYRTPHVAILISAVTTLVFTLNASFLTALTISTISRLLTFAVACLALPVLRRRADVEPATFVVPGGPLIPGAAVVLTIWLLSSSSRKEFIAVAVTALVGWAIYVAGRRVARQPLPVARGGPSGAP
ncbi:MAG TPA: amino acid permease [Gammaproteobacteria bacterium]|jgi:amino acid transporter|nr:amino acid permease [Gammaproteobacteria bacterium]